MEIRFWIDPETDLPHIFRHGVKVEEVEQVLRGSGEEFPGTDRSRTRLGQTTAGRFLQVVYVPDEIGGCSNFLWGGGGDKATNRFWVALGGTGILPVCFYLHRLEAGATQTLRDSLQIPPENLAAPRSAKDCSSSPRMI